MWVSMHDWIELKCRVSQLERDTRMWPAGVLEAWRIAVGDGESYDLNPSDGVALRAVVEALAKRLGVEIVVNRASRSAAFEIVTPDPFTGAT